MKQSLKIFLLLLVICVVASNQFGVSTDAQQQPQQPVVPQPKASPSPASTGNPNQQENTRFVQELSEKIKGRENEPAEQVFKNIQGLKGIPAGRLLAIMNFGYSRALGVSCTHCHMEQDFASDDKRPKRAAREMMALNNTINQQLSKLQHLEPREQRFVNCTTCHRGKVNPMPAG
jgi:hypothetical protein